MSSQRTILEQKLNVSISTGHCTLELHLIFVPSTQYSAPTRLPSALTMANAGSSPMRGGARREGGCPGGRYSTIPVPAGLCILRLWCLSVELLKHNVPPGLVLDLSGRLSIGSIF